MNNVGIVVKNYFPHKAKYSILDRDLGKIVGIPVHDTVSLGAQIEYTVKEKGDIYFIADIRLLEMPLDAARHNILFLHHTLELCEQFVPIGSYIPGLFELVEILYRFPQSLCTIVGKRVFLCKLFTVLGIYPEGAQFHDVQFHRVAGLSIDSFLQHENIGLFCEKQLRQWLMHCIATHPYVKNFKTVHFLVLNEE